jgi:peptidyl-prolyl cis-trans isomerase C
MSSRTNANPASSFAGFLLIALALTACTKADTEYLDKPVLTVNGQTLTAKEFSDRLSKKLRDYDAVTVKSEQILSINKEDVLREYMIETLTEQWAKKNAITVTDAEINSEVDKIRATYPDDLAFRRALTSENISMDSWRNALRSTLIQKKVAETLRQQISPSTAKELESYYDSHKDDFKLPERIRLKQIVLDREENAELVQQELKKGGKFEELAKKFSIAPDASQGGDTGWIEHGALEVFDTAFNLSIGKMSGILKSPYGYHILRVGQKSKARHLSFNEAKDSIRASLLRQKEQTVYKSWLDSQVRAAKVHKDDSLIAGIRVETRGDH